MTTYAPPPPKLGDLPVRERLTVPFEAATGGDSPLTWGQRRVAALIAALHPADATLNLRIACRLAPTAGPADVARALSDALANCEGIRSRYPWTDPDGTQVVVPDGELPLPVLSAAGLDLSYAFRLADDLAEAPFRNDDLPIRVAVVCDDTPDPAASCLLLVVSHLAADFFGIDFLLWYLRDVLPPGPGRVAEPGQVPAQPRDVAAWESGGDGRREGQRAVERHTRALARMPQSMLPRFPQEPLTPRYRYLEMRSRVASTCLAYLGTEHKVGETAVFAAMLAALLSTAGGVDRCHLQLCVTNRLRGPLASAVAPLTQDVPVCLDVAGGNIADLIRRCAGTVLTSSTLGRFPPQDLDAARDAVERDRGLALDLSYWLNSRIRPGTTPPARLDATRLRSDRRHTTVAEVGADSTSTSTVFTYVDRYEDELVVRMMVDSAYVRPAEAQEWLVALEAMLLSTVTSAAVDANQLARSVGVAVPQLEGDWVVVDHSLVHLPTTTRLISQALEVPVRLVPHPDGRRLLAEVDGPPPSREAAARLVPDLVRDWRLAAIPVLGRPT